MPTIKDALDIIGKLTLAEQESLKKFYKSEFTELSGSIELTEEK